MVSPEEMINILDTCNQSCYRSFCFEGKQKKGISYLIKNLPALPYIEEQFMNFMFSNSLTTGDTDTDDKVLNPWLFRRNVLNQTNYDVIRTAILHAKEYGKAGVRVIGDDLIMVPAKRYTTLMMWDTEYKGFKKPIGYAVALKKGNISLGSRPVTINRPHFDNTGQLIDQHFDYIILSGQEFVNLRFDTSTETGVSCFEKDMQRLMLLSRLYERMNYDIEYDGPGRIIFWVKDGLLDVGMDVSTGEIIGNLNNQQKSRKDKAVVALEEISREIKSSKSDNVILAPNIFDHEITQLPKVIKSTDFFGWLDNESQIISNVFGLDPNLIGVGKVSGNVSMEKIIDNAMINSIVPMREKVITQISDLVSGLLGVEKIYFDKYQMKQNNDISQEVYRLVMTAEKLHELGDEEGMRQILDNIKTKV